MTTLPTPLSLTTAVATLASHLKGEHPEGDDATLPSAAVGSVLCFDTIEYAKRCTAVARSSSSRIFAAVTKLGALLDGGW